MSEEQRDSAKLPQEPKSSPGTILLGRLMLAGEGRAPKKLFEGLDQAGWISWLTEPDPNAWPESMRELKVWLQDQQQSGRRRSEQPPSPSPMEQP